MDQAVSSVCGEHARGHGCMTVEEEEEKTWLHGASSMHGCMAAKTDSGRRPRQEAIVSMAMLRGHGLCEGWLLFFWSQNKHVTGGAVAKGFVRPNTGQHVDVEA